MLEEIALRAFLAALLVFIAIGFVHMIVTMSWWEFFVLPPMAYGLHLWKRRYFDGDW